MRRACVIGYWRPIYETVILIEWNARSDPPEPPLPCPTPACPEQHSPPPPRHLPAILSMFPSCATDPRGGCGMSATAAVGPEEQAVYHDVTRLSAQDLYLFNEGTHSRLYEKLGAHLTRDGAAGTHFAVWAPKARVRRRHRRLQRLAHRELTRCGRASRPASGRASFPASAPATVTSTTSSRATTATGRQGRPVRLLPRDAAADRLDRLGPATTPGATRTGWRAAAGTTRLARRSRSTKSTSAPGCACRRRATAG